MLRDGAARFVRENYGFEARRALAKSALGFSRQHWQTYAELGWLALGLPEDAGGLGCPFSDSTVLLEELGRGLALEPFVSTAVLCARILDRCDNVEARSRLLSEVAAGGTILALAHDEPGQRFKIDRAHVSARPVADGFWLDGDKVLAIDGQAADRFIVSATVVGERLPSLFVISREAAGLALEAYRLIDGSGAVDLRLHDVAAVRLTESGNTVTILEEAFDAETVARIAEAIGAMEAVMAMTAEYIKTRVQFGQPIGKFQALQHRMSEMFVEVEKSRSSLFRALAYLDAEPANRKAAVSSAKLAVADATKFVGAQGIQLHGGIGMTEEYSIGHYFKKLIAFEKIHGDSDWHLTRLVTP
ncbi:MAG: acyl-CoA dehydrogenase family protein [Azonexus sp.]|nr:acyl-CoA dehydrogenase family protein [Azonexus sp.]